MPPKRKQSGRKPPTVTKDDPGRQAKRDAALVHKTAGNEAFKTGKFEEGVNHFTLAILEDPEDHVFYSNRSACFAALNQFTRAAEDASKCIELKPDWSKGYSRLGLALFSKGDLKGAQKAYADGLAIEPTSDMLQEALQEVREAKKKADENRKKLEKEMGGVNLEDEMLKVAQNQMDYQAVAGLYQRSLGLIRTAIGKKA